MGSIRPGRPPRSTWIDTGASPESNSAANTAAAVAVIAKKQQEAKGVKVGDPVRVAYGVKVPYDGVVTNIYACSMYETLEVDTGAARIKVFRDQVRPLRD